MNRRNFLSSFISVPAVVAGIGIEELLAPRKSIFLPPIGGWWPQETIWAVKMDGGYFFSNELRELLCNPKYDIYPIVSVRDGERLFPKIGSSRRWSGDRKMVHPASIELI